jgi:hypothetical protein
VASLAESLDDVDYQLRSLAELWSFHFGSGQYPTALSLAQRFCTLATNRSDPDDRLIGERLIGVTESHLGDLCLPIMPSERSADGDRRAK